MRYFLTLIILIGAIFAKDRVVVKLSKTKAYLNEPIVAKVSIKTDKKPLYITLKAFKEKTLYAKLLQEGNITKSNDGYSKIYYYAIFPQATGDIKLEQAIAKVSQREEKTGFVVSKTLLSKHKKLQVFTLPSNLRVSGDLNLQLIQENNVTKMNEPVNFTLIIDGIANVDDINPFKLPIKDATYYTAKPEREQILKEGKLHSIFKQKFTVVADNSFKIEHIKFKYFNTKTALAETLATKPIFIKIDKPIFSNRELIALFVGIILGILLSILWQLRKHKKVPSSLEIAIKKAKNDKELYKILLPYANESKYKKMLEEIEKRIYWLMWNRFDIILQQV